MLTKIDYTVSDNGSQGFILYKYDPYFFIFIGLIVYFVAKFEIWETQATFSLTLVFRSSWWTTKGKDHHCLSLSCISWSCYTLWYWIIWQCPQASLERYPSASRKGKLKCIFTIKNCYMLVYDQIILIVKLRIEIIVIKMLQCCLNYHFTIQTKSELTIGIYFLKIRS